MTPLPLTAGYEVVVDDDVADWLGEYNWKLDSPARRWKYAVRSVHSKKVTVKMYMHRVIANAPKPFKVGAYNGNKLDCRKKNLYVMDQYGIEIEKWQMSVVDSQYRGVKWNWHTGAWEVRYANMHYGMYETEYEAAAAYNIMIHKIRNGGCKLNTLPRIVNVALS